MFQKQRFNFNMVLDRKENFMFSFLLIILFFTAIPNEAIAQREFRASVGATHSVEIFKTSFAREIFPSYRLAVGYFMKGWYIEYTNSRFGKEESNISIDHYNNHTIFQKYYTFGILNKLYFGKVFKHNHLNFKIGYGAGYMIKTFVKETISIKETDYYYSNTPDEQYYTLGFKMEANTEINSLLFLAFGMEMDMMFQTDGKDYGINLYPYMFIAAGIRL